MSDLNSLMVVFYGNFYVNSMEFMDSIGVSLRNIDLVRSF